MDDNIPSDPHPDDWTTTDHLTFREYDTGKIMLAILPGWDMWTHLHAEMDRNGFYPNVWFISDHGNAYILTEDGEVLQSASLLHVAKRKDLID